jgi:hypothetical protein
MAIKKRKAKSPNLSTRRNSNNNFLSNPYPVNIVTGMTPSQSPYTTVCGALNQTKIDSA